MIQDLLADWQEEKRKQEEQEAKLKGGVYWDPSEVLEKNVPIVEQISMEVAGRAAIITSGRDGIHMEGSQHPSGNAMDLRTHDLDPDTIQAYAQKLQRGLGDTFDVVIEDTHIHVEIDPKAMDQVMAQQIPAQAQQIPSQAQPIPPQAQPIPTLAQGIPPQAQGIPPQAQAIPGPGPMAPPPPALPKKQVRDYSNMTPAQRLVAEWRNEEQDDTPVSTDIQGFSEPELSFAPQPSPLPGVDPSQMDQLGIPQVGGPETSPPPSEEELALNAEMNEQARAAMGMMTPEEMAQNPTLQKIAAAEASDQAEIQRRVDELNPAERFAGSFAAAVMEAPGLSALLIEKAADLIGEENVDKATAERFQDADRGVIGKAGGLVGFVGPAILDILGTKGAARLAAPLATEAGFAQFGEVLAAVGQDAGFALKNKQYTQALTALAGEELSFIGADLLRGVDSETMIRNAIIGLLAGGTVEAGLSRMATKQAARRVGESGANPAFRSGNKIYHAKRTAGQGEMTHFELQDKVPGWEDMEPGFWTEDGFKTYDEHRAAQMADIEDDVIVEEVAEEIPFFSEEVVVETPPPPKPEPKPEPEPEPKAPEPEPEPVRVEADVEEPDVLPEAPGEWVYEGGKGGWYSIRDPSGELVERVRGKEKAEAFTKALNDDAKAKVAAEPGLEDFSGWSYDGGKGGWYNIRDGDGNLVERVRGKANAEAALEGKNPPATAPKPEPVTPKAPEPEVEVPKPKASTKKDDEALERHIALWGDDPATLATASEPAQRAARRQGLLPDADAPAPKPAEEIPFFSEPEPKPEPIPEPEPPPPPPPPLRAKPKPKPEPPKVDEAEKKALFDEIAAAEAKRERARVKPSAVFEEDEVAQAATKATVDLSNRQARLMDLPESKGYTLDELDSAIGGARAKMRSANQTDAKNLQRVINKLEDARDELNAGPLSAEEVAPDPKVPSQGELEARAEQAIERAFDDASDVDIGYELKDVPTEKAVEKLVKPDDGGYIDPFPEKGAPIKKVVPWLKRKFYSAANAPQKGYDAWVNRKARVRQQQYRAQKLLSDTYHIIRKEYGIEMLNTPTGELLNGMNRILRQGLNTAPLSDNLVTALVKMRKHVDILSNMHKAEGMVSGDLAATFDARMGMWLNRTYRQFEDPTNWRAGDEQIEKFRNWAREELEDSIGEDQDLEEAVNQWLVDLISVGRKNSDLFGGRSDLSRQDKEILSALSGFVPEPLRTRVDDALKGVPRQEVDKMIDRYVAREGDEVIKTLDKLIKDAKGKPKAELEKVRRDLAKRQEIPEPIRALWGEEANPLVSYAQSVTKAANNIESFKMLRTIKEEGMKQDWVRHGKDLRVDEIEDWVKVAEKGQQNVAPLADPEDAIWMRKDVLW
jgi:hypothetical protein